MRTCSFEFASAMWQLAIGRDEVPRRSQHRRCQLGWQQGTRDEGGGNWPLYASAQIQVEIRTQLLGTDWVPHADEVAELVDSMAPS
jgi:hypothetical protein